MRENKSREHNRECWRIVRRLAKIEERMFILFDRTEKFHRDTSEIDRAEFNADPNWKDFMREFDLSAGPPK